MLKRLAMRYAKNYFLKKIDTPEFQDMIVRTVNRKVNIPNLTERQEAQLFKAVVKAVSAYIRGI